MDLKVLFSLTYIPQSFYITRHLYECFVLWPLVQTFMLSDCVIFCSIPNRVQSTLQIL